MGWRPLFCSVPNCENYVYNYSYCNYCREDMCTEHLNELGLCPICTEKLKDFTVSELIYEMSLDDY